MKAILAVILIVAVGALTALFFWLPHRDSSGIAEWNPRVSLVVGKASIIRPGKQGKTPIRSGMRLRSGDTLVSDSECRMEISLNARDLLVVGENSRIVLKATPIADGRGNIQIVNAFGKVFANIRLLAARRSKFSIASGAATASIRGTAFALEVDPGRRTVISDLEGNVYVQIIAKSSGVELGQGDVLVIKPEKKPPVRRPITKVELEDLAAWIGQTHFPLTILLEKAAARLAADMRAARKREAGFGSNARGAKATAGNQKDIDPRYSRRRKPPKSSRGKISLSESEKAKAALLRKRMASEQEAYRSPDAVGREIRKRVGELRQVYQQHLRKAPGLEGKIVVKFEIMPDGKVSDVGILSSTMNHAEFEKKATTIVRSWRFHPVMKEIGPLTIKYPLEFEKE